MEKNKLRSDLGESRNIYETFKNVFSKMSAKEFYEKYNVEEIKDYFSNNPYDLYKLIVSSLDKKENRTYIYNHLLEDEEFFKLFFDEQENFFSIFYDLDYDITLKILKKLEPKKDKYKAYIVKGLTEEEQERIIEEFEIESLPWILNFVNKKVFNNFFKTNKRAISIIDKMSLTSLIDIKLSNDILFSNIFFEKLKSYSLVNFRTNVNEILKTNPNPNFEIKVEKYLESIINTYNEQTKMFKIYEDITSENIYDKAISSKEKYLLSPVDLHNSKTNLEAYFKNKTKEKLIEMVIDYLFKDNWYNVLLNIKELLRYQNQENTITEEQKYFYEQILNLKNIENEEIINIFNTYKSKNISLMFYQDIRKSKDRSYKKLKENLLKVDKETHLKGEKFTMLIRGGERFSNLPNIERSCYSIIDEDNMELKNGYSFYYGYDNIDDKNIIHNYENDSFSSSTKEPTNLINRIMSPKEITQIKGYSEIQIMNKKEDERYIMPYPSYLLVFDEIKEEEKQEAERLNIPIVVIHKSFYEKKNLEESHIFKTSIEDGFKYIKYDFEENKIKR